MEKQTAAQYFLPNYSESMRNNSQRCVYLIQVCLQSLTQTPSRSKAEDIPDVKGVKISTGSKVEKQKQGEDRERGNEERRRGMI